MGEKLRVLHHKHDQVYASIKHSDVFTKGYRPPWWVGIGSEFFSGSWHTVAHNVMRTVKKGPKVVYSRELVQLSDGGTVGLDWAVSSTDTRTGETYVSPDINDDSFPIVFLHHGLCGSSTSHYVIQAVTLFLKIQKYRVVCLVARGCGNVPLTTPDMFIAARTLDMREALQRIFNRHPQSPVFGVGWSLGAGLMANYIGEEGENCKLAGAFINSPCWDFMCKSPWYKFWNTYFIGSSIVEYAKINLEQLKNLRKKKKINLDLALQKPDIEEFDKLITVPYHGFKDANEYYQKSSPLKVAHRIHIPTLSMNADDDPICSVIGCPTKKKQMGPGLIIVRTKRGGHVSWASTMDAYGSYMDDVMMMWIEACYDHHNRHQVRQKIKRQKVLLASRMSRQLRKRTNSETALADFTLRKTLSFKRNLAKLGAKMKKNKDSLKLSALFQDKSRTGLPTVQSLNSIGLEKPDKIQRVKRELTPIVEGESLNFEKLEDDKIDSPQILGTKAGYLGVGAVVVYLGYKLVQRIRS
eukprot:augustus_masked-scaffold_7-processed-gene-0.41-mRNA-1 protein AED:0.16 eAED:0.18 QI:0/-1/0/1/-1/1/1/0/523